MSEVKWEARRIGTPPVVQIRVGGRGRWRTATTPEDLENAEVVIQAGGTMMVPPKDPGAVDALRSALDRVSTPPPAAMAAAERATTLLDVPPIPGPGSAAREAPSPAASGAPCFLLEGRSVPASNRTQAAALELARAIAADAEAADTDPNAATAWKGARVHLGDLLREVVSFEFGNPKDLPPAPDAFAIVSAR